MFKALFNRRSHCVDIPYLRRYLSTNQLRQYYDILEVTRHSTPKQIKDNFLKLSKVYHPDNKVTGSHTKFVQLKEAYDALKGVRPPPTTGDEFASGRSRADPREPSKPRPQEPISMNHVHYVYRTLNREEQPRYRPFEDHNYEGSSFNRFEYARRWDPDARAWVYSKKATAQQYQDRMKRNSKILNLCLSVIMIGILFNILNYRFFTNDVSKRSVKKINDIDREKAGIYIIRDDKP